MATYNHFIPENVALAGTKEIVVFRDGKKVGRIPLGSLTPPDRSKCLYSFAVLSDTHVDQLDTKPNANIYFEKAITFLDNMADVEFVCIAGDLVGEGDVEDHWKSYKTIASGLKKPMYVTNGNHESWENEISRTFIEYYTGNNSVLYSKEINGDVFIFLGYYTQKTIDNVTYYRYPIEYVREAERLLYENRNKRCFFFQHPPFNGSTPEGNIFKESSTVGYLPLSVYRHYKNTTVFHGHTHKEFEGQKTNKKANYNQTLGIRSVHVPALCDHAQGYIVDVYEDGVHLRGLNFETEDYIPIASYWIDTTIQEISERYTYKGDA